MLYLFMMILILMMKIDGVRVRVNCLTDWLGVLISLLVSFLRLLVGEEGMLYLSMMTLILMMKIEGDKVLTARTYLLQTAHFYRHHHALLDECLMLYLTSLCVLRRTCRQE
jgi:hypothetical protein